MSESHEIAYRGLRTRVREVIEGVDASAFEFVVPATPAWRAHDVLAHLVGVTDDVVHGRMQGIASDRWTQAQVDARTSASRSDLLAEWEELAPRFEEVLGAAPAEIAGQAIFDAATHEHDLRNAFGAVGARETDAVGSAWEWILDARTRMSAPAICFACEAGEQVSGVGDLIARVEAPRFELFRAVAGRRTATEITHYRWDRAPDPASLLASEIFSLAETSIGEE